VTTRLGRSDEPLARFTECVYVPIRTPELHVISQLRATPAAMAPQAGFAWSADSYQLLAYDADSSARMWWMRPARGGHLQRPTQAGDTALLRARVFSWASLADAASRPQAPADHPFQGSAGVGSASTATEQRVQAFSNTSTWGTSCPQPPNHQSQLLAFNPPQPGHPRGLQAHACTVPPCNSQAKMWPSWSARAAQCCRSWRRS
jgi:hypothetical protein